MDVTAQEELKAHLMQTDEQFRQLAQQHADLDQKVAALEAKHALSDEEQVEETRLKKLKLHLKDQMAGILNRYHGEHVV
jgi:uncharacterized protein YdcH (DUF465 family)